MEENKQEQDEEYRTKVQANEDLMAAKAFILISDKDTVVKFGHGGNTDVTFLEWLGLIEYALDRLMLLKQDMLEPDEE